MTGTGRRGVRAQAAVLLGERTVGTLDYHNGDCWFTYQDLDPGHPVLGLRFEDDPSYGRKVSRGSVPIWFANLLPERESGLRRLINSDLGVRESHDFHLLIHLGEDLPGAVRVRPRGHLPSDMPPSAKRPLRGPGDLGFSLSGMQLKFSMTRADHGFVLPDPGSEGDWIVKLPSQVHLDLPANEYAMMRWAGSVGIEVPEHLLVSAADLAGMPSGLVAPGMEVFAVRRFDRTSSGRVHQEDFAQVLSVRPHQKASGEQELLARIVADNCPDEDTDELVRRIVFCIAAGNTDEHLKNWSLRYPDGRLARLSPAYDLVSATSYPAFERSHLTLPVAGQRDPRYLRLDHFRRFADEVGLDSARVAEVAAETVDGLKRTWRRISGDPRTPGFVAEHVTNRLTVLPLMRGE